MDPVLIAFALLVRTFVLEPYSMPSRSMAPTLVEGDVMLASKMAYGYSRFSPPQFIARSLVLPHGRIAPLSPRRGDVVIFKLPSDGDTDYIKRLIGLPGDKIQMIKGRLYINGEIAPHEPIAPYETVGHFGKPIEVRRYIETLPGGVRHEIIQLDGDNGLLANTPVYEAPPGHYFVLGDNRDNSTDSRVPAQSAGVGFVPRDNLVGKVKWVLFSAPETEDGDHSELRFLKTVH